MEDNYRKQLIKIVTFLGGLYFFLEFLLPEVALESIGITAKEHDAISYGFIIFGSTAFGLGLINLFMVHGSRIVFGRKHWSYSVVLLTGLIVMMVATTLDWLGGLSLSRRSQQWATLAQFAKVIEADHKANRSDVPSLDVRVGALIGAARDEIESLRGDLVSGDKWQRVPEDDVKYHLIAGYTGELRRKIDALEKSLMDVEGSFDPAAPNFELIAPLSAVLGEIGVGLGKLLRLDFEFSLTRNVYNFLFHGLFVALGSAMFSLLGVYIAAAAFRAFRVKSLESSLMMIAAVIVMLGQIPFYVYIYDDLPIWRQWLLEVPNSAAFRAIKIGAAVAGLVMAFRMWFSIESESFSDTSEGNA